MAEQIGRIWFPGNPWPNGHAIKRFDWSGCMDAKGSLRFDLHLETVDYDSEAEPAIDEEDDWRAPGVWGNYHSCTISSTEWKEEGTTGLAAGSPEAPLVWGAISETELVADEAEQGAMFEFDPPAFWTYLTGHDAVADHHVRFLKSSQGAFDLEWRGRIALAYAGDNELKHTFRAVVPGVRFQGFAAPKGMSVKKAGKLFATSCRDAELFVARETPAGVVLSEVAR